MTEIKTRNANAIDIDVIQAYLASDVYFLLKTWKMACRTEADVATGYLREVFARKLREHVDALQKELAELRQLAEQLEASDGPRFNGADAGGQQDSWRARMGLSQPRGKGVMEL